MIIIFLLIIATLLGCITPYNTAQNQSGNFATAAFYEQEKGNWDKARILFGKSINNALIAKMDSEYLAVLYYEYGRSYGVTCIYDEAEFFLNKANDLDAQSDGPKYLSLVELARLNLDQNKWNNAINYFDSAILELDKNNAPEISPHGYADVLDEYALALTELNKPEATSYHQRADDIRKKYPQGKSITDRTPYGTQCVN